MILHAIQTPAIPPVSFPARSAPVAGASTPRTNPRCAATIDVPHTRRAAFMTISLSFIRFISAITGSALTIPTSNPAVPFLPRPIFSPIHSSGFFNSLCKISANGDCQGERFRLRKPPSVPHPEESDQEAAADPSYKKMLQAQFL